MKPLSQEHIQRINAKTAELCGWTISYGDRGAVFAKHPTTGVLHCWFPNYWQSLDACAEFEEPMESDTFDKYSAYLVRHFGRSVRATAPQRVTAFLAVHNLTIEEI